mgnify:CR=1 FL=1
MNEANEKNIQEKLSIYRQAWLASDIDLFSSIWDETYPNLTFMPMERARILRGWESIIEYWKTILPITRMERWDITNSIIDFLASDVAWVFCEHEFAYRVTDGTQEGLQEYEARTTHIFRRTSDGEWKVIHYEDSIQWFPSSDEARRAAD